MSKIIVSPSLLAFKFNDINRALDTVSKSTAPWVHLDVMDGNFVPPITFGAQLIKDSRPYSRLFFDTHLMVNHPETHIKDFASSGSDAITIHLESTVHVNRALMMIKDEDKMAGISIVPSTPVQSLLPVLDMVDIVLVMSVNPGYGGQKFIDNSVDKISLLNAIRKDKNYNFKISVDGGVNESNAEILKKNGADILVTGSSFVKAEDKRLFVEKLSSRI